MACKVNVYMSNLIRHQLRQQITIYHESAYIRRTNQSCCVVLVALLPAPALDDEISLPRGSAATSIPAGKRKLHCTLVFCCHSPVRCPRSSQQWSQRLFFYGLCKALRPCPLSLSLSLLHGFQVADKLDIQAWDIWDSECFSLDWDCLEGHTGVVQYSFT